MKLLIVLGLICSIGAGFWLGKAVYQVKLTPGQCLDATTQSIGESIDNFIANIKG